MAVEREGEGQENGGRREGKTEKGKENGGKRQGKSPKTLHKQKGCIVHYDALSYIKAPASKSRGFVIKKEGVPLDTPSEYLLIPIRMICKIPVYNPKRSLIIIPHIPIGKYS